MINIETFEICDHFLLNSQVSTHLIGFEANELHNHNFIEFSYVLQGTCTHNLNGTISVIKQGEAFLFVPSDYHQYINRHSEDFIHRDIIFTYDYFKEICKAYSNNLYDELIDKKYPLHFFLSSESISQIESIIPNVLTSQSQSLAEITTKILSYSIINNILSLQLTQPTAIPDWLTKVLFFMNSPESINTPLKIFLNTLPYSHGYMCHQFKKHVGMTMTEYYNQQKMKHANTLLRTTDYTIETVCEKIGFTNISHFYTLFKKQYGITPAKLKSSD